jgi:tetratricopeptide (TPR) repeat protein
LHDEVAEVLEALYGEKVEKIAVQLAHHFTHAETWEKAFLRLTRSGDRARRAYGNQEAIAFYTQATEVSGKITPPVDEAQLFPVYEGRGAVWLLLSRLDEAIADFHRVRQMARASRDQQKEGESLSNLANAHYRKLSGEAIPLIEQYAQEAVRLAQLTGDQRTLAKSLTSLAFVDQSRGELDEADRKFEESLRISRLEGYMDSMSVNLTQSGVIAGWHGDYRRAIALCQESLALARELHDGFLELLNLCCLCLYQASLGNYTEGLNTIREGMTKARERDKKYIVSRLTNTLGWFHSLFNDFSRAAEYDQKSAELGGSYGQHHVEIISLINLGADYVGLGQYERARSHLGEVLERIEPGESVVRAFLGKQRLLNVLGEACHALGDHGEALHYVEESLSIAVSHSSQKYMAKGWALRGRILAHLGKAEAAGENLRRAFELAEKLNSPSVTYPIAFDLGQWCEDAGQDQEAARLYGKARDTIDCMVTSIDDQALQSTFLQSALVRTINDSWDRTR